jgi:hypothetical protein
MLCSGPFAWNSLNIPTIYTCTLNVFGPSWHRLNERVCKSFKKAVDYTSFRIALGDSKKIVLKPSRSANNQIDIQRPFETSKRDGTKLQKNILPWPSKMQMPTPEDPSMLHPTVGKEVE